jgi:hypothetical protein
MSNFRGRFSHLTFRSPWCSHRFRVTPKQLFRPLKPLSFILKSDQSFISSPEHFRIERMSYKNISICLSELNSFNFCPKTNLYNKKSKKIDFSNPPFRQIRVAKSAMFSPLTPPRSPSPRTESPERTEMIPSTKRSRRATKRAARSVKTRDPGYSSLCSLGRDEHY